MTKTEHDKSPVSETTRGATIGVGRLLLMWFLVFLGTIVLAWCGLGVTILLMNLGEMLVSEAPQIMARLSSRLLDAFASLAMSPLIPRGLIATVGISGIAVIVAGSDVRRTRRYQRRATNRECVRVAFRALLICFALSFIFACLIPGIFMPLL